MDNKEKILLCIEKLKSEYPNSKCSLTYNSPLEMLIATRLSAQCTDLRVNEVTPTLFAKFPDAHAFANADICEVEKCIYTCGLYKTKARDIVEMCKKIINEFDGKVPDTMEKLTSLPGVGRKTANLVLGDIYGKPAIVVDTHFIRITHRLGFHNSKDAVTIEKIMRNIVPEDESNSFCHRIVSHGRAICNAKKPKCDLCCLKEFCTYFNIDKNFSKQKI